VNAAEHVRCHLAAARVEGIDFDSAWSAALSTLPLDAADDAGPAERRELECWEGAIRWSRPFFQAAYLREPWSRAEAAAGSIQELVA